MLLHHHLFSVHLGRQGENNMDERYSHPYDGGSNGVGGQSSASFASSSKLKPPTYLAQAPTFSSPKPRQSSGSLRRSIVGDSSIDSIHKEVGGPSSFNHSHTTQIRRGRKSAFDTFDELSFCNDLASKIANELAARPPRNLRRNGPIDPWRGTIPGSNVASVSGQEDANIQITESLDVAQNGVEDQQAKESEEDDESEDEDESDSEEDSEEDDNEEEDVEHDDAALDAERTERTRLATEAFLQRLAEREAEGNNVDESEKDLEKQVFEIFGGGNKDLNKEQEILASTDQLDQEEEVSPEVAMQVAQMLQKPAMQSQSGQRPLIQEVDQQAEPSEILGDSSMEYDQLKSTSSEAANIEDGMSGDHENVSEDEIEEDEDDDDSIPGEDAMERKVEDGEEDEEEDDEEDEDEDEDDESDGVEEDYYDDSQRHQHLYSQPSRSNSMGMYGSNQEEAISLIDSDEEDERPANSQPADFNQIAYDAARYERYQDGSDDEQEQYEEEQEMKNDEEEGHDQNGMELLEESNHQLPGIDAALFQNNQSVPVFEPALASTMPSDPSHLWQDSIQQSIQALADLAQAPPAEYEENVSSDQTPFQSSMPQAAFSPNLFEQTFPTSSTSIENQAPQQITPQDPIWSSLPVPPSPAPPPPAEAEAIGTADGEALLQLKAQVNEQMEEEQQRSHRTSMSPIPPSTVQTPQANQSLPSTPKPTAGHVKDGGDLVDLKNVVKRAAGLRSQRSSVASDIGTPRTDVPMPSGVEPIVEEEEGEEVTVDENLVNTTEATREKVDVPPAVEEEEGEEVLVDRNSVNTTEAILEKVDIPPADQVLEVVKEDLNDADEDKALEEVIEIDHSIPEVEVKIEAPTADEDVKASGLTEEAETAIVAPATEETEQEPVSVTESLKVPDKVDVQEDDSKHADKNEIEEAVNTSPKVSPTRKGNKRRSVSETPIEADAEIGDADVPILETRRNTRSSTKRAASEALSTKSEHETVHDLQTHSSPHSHRKPRKSDPDGDLADYVPDDIRRKRMRSRTRSPSVAREIALPTSIGIPDKLLDTSILEEDEGEEDEEQQELPQQEEQQPQQEGLQQEEHTPSLTPVKKKRGRKPKKKTEIIEQSTEDNLPEQSSNDIQPDSQSSQPDSTASPRKKTEAEKREYKKNQKRTYDKKRRRSTRNMDSNSAVEGKGEETSYDDSQNSKNDVESEAKREAPTPVENVQPKTNESSPPPRVTRRRTRQLTGEQEAEGNQSQGTDQSMAEVEAEAEQQDENKRGAKKPRRGRSKDKR